MCILKTTSIILLLVSSWVFAQNEKVIFMCNRKIDTLPYIQENIERNKFYGVRELELLSEKYIFRSWAGNCCIEIMENDGQLSGKIYFAVEGFNKKRFRKSYKLLHKEAEKLFYWVTGYEYMRRKNKEIAVAHTFEVKENSNIEVYTTDSPQLEYKISDIVEIEKYWKKFEKENPFRKFTYWELIQTGKVLEQEPHYMTKRNE